MSAQDGKEEEVKSEGRGLPCVLTEKGREGKVLSGVLARVGSRKGVQGGLSWRRRERRGRKGRGCHDSDRGTEGGGRRLPMAVKRREREGRKIALILI